MAEDQLKAHLEFFEELGVDGISRDRAWRMREDPIAPAREPEIAPASAAEIAPAGAARIAPASEASIALTSEARIAPTRAAEIAPTSEDSIAPTSAADMAPTSAAEITLTSIPNRPDTLTLIKSDIGHDCSRCKLHTLGRTQVVFGVGNPNADLMFVGEAPGADEDAQGEPFVGRAGQLLTKIIEAIGMTRDQVYIANVIKCRPPGNRNPEPDEVAQCEPFLFRQIDTIKPKVIVALGKFAAQCLLRTETPISRLRGQEFAYRDAILMPTFHPAYLLRNPSSKREVWEDMKRVRDILNRPPEA